MSQYNLKKFKMADAGVLLLLYVPVLTLDVIPAPSSVIHYLVYRIAAKMDYPRRC